jgi:hypothetical protein
VTNDIGADIPLINKWHKLQLFNTYFQTKARTTRNAKSEKMYIALLVITSLVLAILFASKSLQSKPIPGIPLLAGASVAKQFGGEALSVEQDGVNLI